jgi:hypothetical protein
VKNSDCLVSWGKTCEKVKIDEGDTVENRYFDRPFWGSVMFTVESERGVK